MAYLFIIFGVLLLIIIIFIFINNQRNRKENFNLITTTKIIENKLEYKTKNNFEIKKYNARVFLSSPKYNNMDFNISLAENIKKGVELKEEEKHLFFEIYENALLNEIEIDITTNYDEEIIFYIYELIIENKTNYFNITKCILSKNNTFIIKNKIYKIKENDIYKLENIINI